MILSIVDRGADIACCSLAALRRATATSHSSSGRGGGLVPDTVSSTTPQAPAASTNPGLSQSHSGPQVQTAMRNAGMQECRNGLASACARTPHGRAAPRRQLGRARCCGTAGGGASTKTQRSVVADSPGQLDCLPPGLAYCTWLLVRQRHEAAVIESCTSFSEATMEAWLGCRSRQRRCATPSNCPWHRFMLVTNPMVPCE